MRIPFVIGLLLATVAVAAAAQDSPAVIRVTATGTVEREAERARVTFAVQTSAATAREAGQQNAAILDRVIGELRRLPPVSDVRTGSYFVTPRYPRDLGDDVQAIGYTVHNTVRVTVDSVRLVGNTIDVGLAAGANQVAGLSFELRDPEQAYRDALGRAVAEARRQAEVLATAAGGGVGRILSISTGGEPGRLVGAQPQVMMRAEVATPIEPGETSVTATVTIEFELVVM